MVILDIQDSMDLANLWIWGPLDVDSCLLVLTTFVFNAQNGINQNHYSIYLSQILLLGNYVTWICENKKSSFEFSLISNQENAKNKLFESSKIIYKSKLRILLNYFLDHLILIFYSNNNCNDLLLIFDILTL